MLQVALIAVVVGLAALPRAGESVIPVVAAQPQPVATPAAVLPQEASIAFSTIEVVVNRNDTMDRLFRRFELNLADLATLRGLPELRTQLGRSARERVAREFDVHPQARLLAQNLLKCAATPKAWEI